MTAPNLETRGPSEAAARTSAAAVHSVADQGPLVSGPLGPLVSARLDLGALTERLEARWGAAPDTGSFACPLPEHKGTALLGVPPDDPDGDLRLLCCRGRWRSVGEVRAAEAYGVDLQRTNIEIAVWTRRLAYEVGGFSPVDVRLPGLPDAAGSDARAARDGFALLVGLRWADHEQRPVTFSVRFCVAWCGFSSLRVASVAINRLIEHRVVVEAGSVGSGSRSTRLFMPGRLLREVPRPPDDEDALVAALVAEFNAREEPA